MRLSAAIIAGGRSHRMGRDKALLPDAAHGTLLRRQLALLASFHPAELLLSCRPDQDLPSLSTLRCIHDPGTTGPLGGLAALLGAMRGDILLVLAVDLGAMTAEVLGSLLDATTPHRGVVPRTARGIEPLAATYPRALAAEAARRLAVPGDRSLQGLARAGVASGHLAWHDVPAHDLPAFANWNTPEDLPPSPPG